LKYLGCENQEYYDPMFSTRLQATLQNQLIQMNQRFMSSTDAANNTICSNSSQDTGKLLTSMLANTHESMPSFRALG